jgi:hypothetical protein
MAEAEMASFTIVVTPSITTISWLQSNCYASPGANVSGTKASAVALAFAFAQLRA